MTGVRCKIDPDNCRASADVDDPQGWLTRHLLLKHPSTPPDMRQVPSVEWEVVALDALQHLARSKPEFTIFEVQDYGVVDPADPQHAWGTLAKKARHLGLIEPVMVDDGYGNLTPKAVESKRPGTRSSLVKVWRGTARIRPQAARRAG